MSKSRKPMSRRGSKKLFKKGLKTETKNLVPPPQRGGYRM